jgi:hypothetical protein
MCPILDGYGVTGIFFIPVHALVWTAGGWRTQLGGLSFASIILPADSPTQLQTVQFPYLDTWKVFKECGEGGWVGIGLANVYRRTRLLLRVQKPLLLTLQWLYTLPRFRTIRS